MRQQSWMPNSKVAAKVSCDAVGGRRAAARRPSAGCICKMDAPPGIRTMPNLYSLKTTVLEGSEMADNAPQQSARTAKKFLIEESQAPFLSHTAERPSKENPH